VTQAYREQRLAVIRPSILRKEFSNLHHMFEVARQDMGSSTAANPLSRLGWGQLRQAMSVGSDRARSRNFWRPQGVP
jgi:hypothetical protein